MLHHKLRLHPERSSFFDRERLRAQAFQGAGRRQVDDDVWAAIDFEAEGFDHTTSLVGGVDGEGGGGA